MIDANLGDSPWWCALDAAKFEADFLAPPAAVSAAKFDAWLDRYEQSHGDSIEGEIDAVDRLCPLVDAERRLDGRGAGLLLYLVCVNECGVFARRGRHQKSPGRTLVDLFTDSALVGRGFRQLLEQAGYDYAWFRSGWRLLCKTAGFDLDAGASAKLPPWLDATAASVSGYAGLLDPGEVRELAALSRTASGRSLRDAIAVVAPKFDCRQDADELAQLVDVATEAAAGGHWLLSVQAAT